MTLSARRGYEMVNGAEIKRTGWSILITTRANWIGSVRGKAETVKAAKKKAREILKRDERGAERLAR